MDLRWYETYDKDGVDSGPTLQYRNEGIGWQVLEWEDVRYIREREITQEED